MNDQDKNDFKAEIAVIKKDLAEVKSTLEKIENNRNSDVDGFSNSLNSINEGVKQIDKRLINSVAHDWKASFYFSFLSIFAGLMIAGFTLWTTNGNTKSIGEIFSIVGLVGVIVGSLVVACDRRVRGRSHKE